MLHLFSGCFCLDSTIHQTQQITNPLDKYQGHHCIIHWIRDGHLYVGRTHVLQVSYHHHHHHHHHRQRHHHHHHYHHQCHHHHHHHHYHHHHHRHQMTVSLYTQAFSKRLFCCINFCTLVGRHPLNYYKVVNAFWPRPGLEHIG